MNLSQSIALVAIVILLAQGLAIQMVEYTTHIDPLGRKNVRGTMWVYLGGIVGTAIFWMFSVIRGVDDPAYVWQIGAICMAGVTVLIAAISLLHVAMWVLDQHAAKHVAARAS